MTTPPDGPSWGKAPPALVAAFDTAMAQIPGIERRQMFGYPAAFAGGHLVTGLFEDRWMVRLPDDALVELAAAGGGPFEPMPGRPMRGYLTFPPEMVGDPAALRPWLDRALAHVRTLPPKAAKR
jgi:hypothetical protein